MPEALVSPLTRVLPENPQKGSTFYNLKAVPSRYFAAMLALAREIGPDWCKFSFCPTRSSCVLCHVKFDTEAMAQLFIPYKTCVEARKSFGPEGRKEYNDWVWNSIVDRKKVDSKSRKFSFHHKISMDGVAVSVLLSRAAAKGQIHSASHGKSGTGTSYLVSRVGVDPGKKNIVTMTDEKGLCPRFTSRQHMFESGETRLRAVLEREKERTPGLLAEERALSMHCRKTCTCWRRRSTTKRQRASTGKSGGGTGSFGRSARANKVREPSATGWRPRTKSACCSTKTGRDETR